MFRTTYKVSHRTVTIVHMGDFMGWFVKYNGKDFGDFVELPKGWKDNKKKIKDEIQEVTNLLLEQAKNTLKEIKKMK